jgi:hypothetical protein
VLDLPLSSRLHSRGNAWRGARDLLPVSWDFTPDQTQEFSGITVGLSAGAGAGNGPTIGLSEIGPGARVRGAARCGRQPGELETWNSGIRAARREVARRRPAVARSARVGRARAAAMASPMARRRASPAARGKWVQCGLARLLTTVRSTVACAVTHHRTQLWQAPSPETAGRAEPHVSRWSGSSRRRWDRAARPQPVSRQL